MMHESPFTSLMADSTGSQAINALYLIVEQLNGLRTPFDYGMNFRDITKMNIDSAEGEIRAIIQQISTSPDIKRLLRIPDAPLDSLRAALNRMYLATDILEHPKAPLSKREKLYQYYNEINGHLSEAIRKLNETK